MKPHFQSMARYNAWANRRLFEDAARQTDEARGRDVGIYFKSLFATLSHLLQTDRAWMFILGGGRLAEMKLPHAPTGFDDLQTARFAQDRAFVEWIDSLDDAWFDRSFEFVSGLGSFKGMTYTGTHASTLTHVLNHQTHHRGQAHAALTLLGVQEPLALDLLVQGFLQPSNEDRIS